MSVRMFCNAPHNMIKATQNGIATTPTSLFDCSVNFLPIVKNGHSNYYVIRTSIVLKQSSVDGVDRILNSDHHPVTKNTMLIMLNVL